MPGSLPTFKREVAAHIRVQLADGAPAVDIGPGAGWWADLVGIGRMDAVEVFGPYVDRYGLRQKYRTVTVNTVTAVDPSAYGWRYAIMGDVLEHLTAEDAQYVVRTWTAAGVRLMVALPFLSPQDATADNDHEAHLQTDLTPEVVAERFPELRPLALADGYGYFVNYPAEMLEPDGMPPLEPPHHVNVLWWEGARGYWDHGMVARHFAGDLWPTVRPFSFVEHEHARAVGDAGAVVVVSGRWAAHAPADLVRWEDRRAWTLAIITSDEESALDPRRALNPNSLAIVQTPGPHIHPEPRPGAVRSTMVIGPRNDLWRTVRDAGIDADPGEVRPHLWCFSGQVRDNVSRQACVAAAGDAHRAHPEDAALLHVTGGFGQGASYHEYLAQLRASDIALSPSGPATPDCFRTWEALCMGALPIAEAHSPTRRYVSDYYAHALGVDPAAVPFPRVRDWRAELPAILDRYRDDRVMLNADRNRAVAWWQGYQRRLAYEIDAAISAVSGALPQESGRGLRSKLTVIIPASPIPSHPATDVLAECIASLRAYPDLAECEILVTFDGVRPEQEHRRADYEEHMRRVLWRCAWDPAWRGVLPVRFDAHAHQSGMLLGVLPMIRTPLLLYVEADTRTVGEIPWSRLAHAVEHGAGGLRMLRLHYDQQIHPEHEYLMLDRAPVDCAGVPVRRTRQWSQRPHMARVDYYETRVASVFTPADRTFIEDIVYGRGESGSWEHWGLGIYAPPGGMQRSTTCDGRGSDPKLDIIYGGKRMKA